jgi:hypothetical protein
LIQAQNGLTLEEGCLIQANGGTANLPVPRLHQQKLPLYEGNVRNSGAIVAGGLGGAGAPGRVLIEAPNGSNALNGGARAPSLFSGLFLPDTEESFAFSVPIQLGLGPGGVVRPTRVRIASQTVSRGQFGYPSGTDVIFLWQGARVSDLEHGDVGPFEPGVRNIADLDPYDFLRFQVIFKSNSATREAPAVQHASVSYEMPD